MSREQFREVSARVTRIHDVTNMFVNLDKYILNFRQIHLAIWTNPEVSTRVTLRTHDVTSETLWALHYWFDFIFKSRTENNTTIILNREHY